VQDLLEFERTTVEDWCRTLEEMSDLKLKQSLLR
jgi:hypothetical protein